MPSMPAKIVIVGLTTSSGAFASPLGSTFWSSGGTFNSASSICTWYPDPYVRPFNVSVGCFVNSTGTQTYNVEHTFDYLGGYSSNINGFVSSAATWFQNTGITNATSNANGNYAFPVTAIRLNVLTGSSAGTVSMILNQAG